MAHEPETGCDRPESQAGNREWPAPLADQTPRHPHHVEQRLVLSAQQITDGAGRGKVDPAGKSIAQTIDTEEAVATALQAFEDGLYLVVIDESERRDLDERVSLSDGSCIFEECNDLIFVIRSSTPVLELR